MKPGFSPEIFRMFSIFDDGGISGVFCATEPGDPIKMTRYWSRALTADAKAGKNEELNDVSQVLAFLSQAHMKTSAWDSMRQVKISQTCKWHVLFQCTNEK